MNIPEKYQPVLLSNDLMEGYFEWSLNFFTDKSIIQNPFLDLTLQLDVTDAYKKYLTYSNEKKTFFSFLIWNIVKAQSNNISFKLRLIDDKWYILNNAPVVVPVAVGGKQRLLTMLLEDVAISDYEDFSNRYYDELIKIRNGSGYKPTEREFQFAQFFGNLPNIQFTGFTLHHRLEEITGQSVFYFGKRYEVGEKLFIPLATKLHHACTDPYVFDILLTEFNEIVKL